MENKEYCEVVYWHCKCGYVYVLPDFMLETARITILKCDCGEEFENINPEFYGRRKSVFKLMKRLK